MKESQDQTENSDTEYDGRCTGGDNVGGKLSGVCYEKFMGNWYSVRVTFEPLLKCQWPSTDVG